MDTGATALEGEWTIERASELKEILLRAVAGRSPIEIDLQGITRLDLSCLQLLCSAHKTAVELGKSLAIVGGQPEPVKGTARQAGFTRIMGCHPQGDAECLWKGGKGR